MLRPCVVLLFAGSLLAQQEIVHYAFDNTDSDQVLNYARGPIAGPAFGTMTYPASWTYTDGRFGGALQASPYVGLSGRAVRTGWNGPYQGPLTIAFFLRNQLANSIGSYSPVAGQPGWSIATGGSAGAGLQLHGWGGPDLNANFGVSLCAMPGWNHFAITIDPQAGQATWYRNGAVAVTTAITSGVSFGTGELQVGRDLINVCGSLYDIDEFRMFGRTASAAEILAMAQAPAAVVQSFGTAAGATVTTQDVPAIGTTVDLLVNDQSAVAFAFVAGFSYAQHGAQTLPINLGTLLPQAAGRMLLVAPQVTLFGALSSGEGHVTIGIPSNTQLRGVQLFGQVLGLTAAGGVDTSNAIALRVGGGV